ncbi:MAG: DUF3574 domain-containing protein [Reyranellaceae bacterium]
MALLAAALTIAGASASSAQMPPWRSADTLKSEIYFGLRLADGKTVSEDDWNKFLTEIVMPRFPDGLTVIDGVGRSANAAKAVNPTKILVLVHPNVGDAPQRISEIKAEYRKRFGSTGVFHTDMPVRIAPAD